MATCDRSRVLNFNIGVLGHVDSGKTSLGEDGRFHQVNSTSYVDTQHIPRTLLSGLPTCGLPKTLRSSGTDPYGSIS